ncbi:MAG: hypothetical protein EOO85_28520 [Pedobacter sp.]|nr:MAG: hypothetical protein EOO85_28520 [Pedobacter sp.]
MKWELSEDQLIKEHYENLGASRLAYILGRSEQSIYTRAHRLGIEGRDLRWSTDRYIKELRKKNIPYLPEEDYIDTDTSICHRCTKCNTKFNGRPCVILQKDKKCPTCYISCRFDPSKPAILYFVTFMHNDKQIYKIGITNRSVKKRFDKDWTRLNMELCWSRSFDVGQDALDQEIRLLDKYSSYKVNTGVLTSGNTETVSVYIEEKELEVL